MKEDLEKKIMEYTGDVVSKVVPIIAQEIFDEFEKLNLIPPDKYEDWCEFKALRERWEK